MKDLFENEEMQPIALRKVLSKYDFDNITYDDCNRMLKEVEAVGYTFDYGLDGMPHSLRSQLQNTPIYESKHSDKVAMYTSAVGHLIALGASKDYARRIIKAQQENNLKKLYLTDKYKVRALFFNK